MTHTNTYSLKIKIKIDKRLSLLSILILISNMVLGARIQSRRHLHAKRENADPDPNTETECQTVWNRAKNEIGELGNHAQYESIKTYSGEILQKKCGKKGHVFDISFCLSVCQLELGDRCNTELKPGIDMCAPGLTCSNETNKCIHQNYGLNLININDFDDSLFDDSSINETNIDKLISILMQK
jgi:hypothetical protein